MTENLASVPLRPASKVMRLTRMGASFPTRLSFMRSLIRQLSAEKATVTRPVWEMDNDGYGRAVFSVDLDGDTYSLIAFSNDLDPQNRTDRVIAEAWDAAFTLFDGVPETSDLDRLQAMVPKQEAGRCSEKELVLSRANKSMRFFEHTVCALAEGRQPDADLLQQTGYLMRTTAVYGNGKFGIADRSKILDRSIGAHPFRVEMLTVWLIREFSHDLVEHVAKARNPKAAKLSPASKQFLGIGNSTGLGMAPFVINHPLLINNWVMARETALARVLSVKAAKETEISAFLAFFERAQQHVKSWSVADVRQEERTRVLETELASLASKLNFGFLASDFPWQRVIDLCDSLSFETQECLVAMMLEPYGALVDDLVDKMVSTTNPSLAPAMTVNALVQIIKTDFEWATSIEFDAPNECAQFWYVSEEKLEPRLGMRHSEDGADKEQPLDIARQIKVLQQALKDENDENTVATFLQSHPQFRQIIRRVQSSQKFPFSEVQDNMIADTCLPIDILRFKLAFFGACKFDPRSDRWTRITMFQGAPCAAEICTANASDWCFPVYGGE
ncbi:hypothetical protein RB2150_15406 [Rhodobacteraceae bacterium HTCC2150]|nr:hypothetical protein RB2150_15406 [Rhodobacteraceae bacterium HTCC2150]